MRDKVLVEFDCKNRIAREAEEYRNRMPNLSKELVLLRGMGETSDHTLEASSGPGIIHEGG
jgi:hypothetical protein